MDKRNSILIILTLILLIGGVVLFGVKKIGKEEVIDKKADVKKETENAQGKNKEEIKDIDTSDWQTYRNEELGFEFRYPKEFMRELRNNSVILHKDCSKITNENDIAVNMRCELENHISFGFADGSPDKFIEDYKDDFLNGEPLTRIISNEDYTIDGVMGRKLEGATAEGAGGNDYVFVRKNDKDYLISFNQSSTVNLKIISTFKFTEKTNDIDTSDRQIYRNEDLGFEFKYPKDWKIKEITYPIKKYIGGDSDQVFRYLSIEASDFKVELGVKNTIERNIESRSWRTGIPEGDFERGGNVRIGMDLAEKRYLIYKDGSESHVNLVWYCQPKEDIHKWCNNFSVGKNKTAFVEIDVTRIKDDSWKEIEMEVDNIIKTIVIF